MCLLSFRSVKPHQYVRYQFLCFRYPLIISQIISQPPFHLILSAYLCLTNDSPSHCQSFLPLPYLPFPPSHLTLSSPHPFPPLPYLPLPPSHLYHIVPFHPSHLTLSSPHPFPLLPSLPLPLPRSPLLLLTSLVPPPFSPFKIFYSPLNFPPPSYISLTVNC